jgi:hypothetical protein
VDPPEAEIRFVRMAFGAGTVNGPGTEFVAAWPLGSSRFFACGRASKGIYSYKVHHAPAPVGECRRRSVVPEPEVRIRMGRERVRTAESGHWRMIPKNVQRLSEKIMLKQQAGVG